MHIHWVSSNNISLPTLKFSHGSGEEKDRQTFFLRLLFLLPNPGEALLDLVSQVLPSAASEWHWWLLPSPEPPEKGRGRMGSPQEDLWCEQSTVRTENQFQAKRSLAIPLWGQEEQLATSQSRVFALPCADRVVILVLFQSSQKRPKLSYNRFLHFSEEILWSSKEKKKQHCCSQLEPPLEQQGNVFFVNQPVFTC